MQNIRDGQPMVFKHDFKPLEEAIKEYDIIEIVEGESYEIK